jgi:hypothetical protein
VSKRVGRLVAAVAAATWASCCCLGAVAAERETPTASTGPCTGSINGDDVTDRSSTDPDDAVEVEADDSIVITVSAPQAIGHYSIQLGFAGFYWTVVEDDADDTQWSRTVEVADYARFGVGLYQIRAVSEGDVLCSGTILVRVGGNPFSSVGGWVALALTGTGVAATVVALRRPRQRIPSGAIALGAVGGLGAVLLLQQFGQAFPTRVVVVAGVLGGAAVPLIAHLIARSIAAKVASGGPGSPPAPPAPPPSPPPAPPAPPAPIPTATPDSWAAPAGPVA